MKTPIISRPVRSLIREGIFPRGCALCGNSLRQKEAAFYGLCTSCRETFVIPEAERGRCSCCGQPLISEAVTCLSCRNGPERSFDRIIPLFPYTGKYQKILTAYKFGKCLSLGNFFVEETLMKGLDFLQIAVQFSGQFSAPISNLCWVPVPPKPGKIKNSGWDQIEYLAALLKKKGLPVRRCLERLPSENQKKLNKEKRRENLKNRILVKNNGNAKSVVPKTALLFDDVYTTGSTMDACAAALKSGGAERVYGICLCYDL